MRAGMDGCLGVGRQTVAVEASSPAHATTAHQLRQATHQAAIPRQSLRRGRPKSISPQGSGFQTWKQAQVPVMNQFIPPNTLAWLPRPTRLPLSPFCDPSQDQHSTLQVKVSSDTRAHVWRSPRSSWVSAMLYAIDAALIWLQPFVFSTSRLCSVGPRVSPHRRSRVESLAIAG